MSLALIALVTSLVSLALTLIVAHRVRRDITRLRTMRSRIIALEREKDDVQDG